MLRLLIWVIFNGAAKRLAKKLSVFANPTSADGWTKPLKRQTNAKRLHYLSYCNHIFYMQNQNHYAEKMLI